MYTSKFHEQLKNVTFLMNGVYWEPQYPRVLTKEQLKTAKSKGDCKLMGVCDISADFEGSIEFTSRFTSIEEPFLIWDAVKQEFREKIQESDPDCILFHSVDHLPAEMPKEASNHFGEQLYPFVAQVVNSNIHQSWDKQVQELPEEIHNAVICVNGELTSNFRYISELRAINDKIKN